MKTRCKPGDIAFLINNLTDAGKIVNVIRLYTPEERVSGVLWNKHPGAMWIVESFGSLLSSDDHQGRKHLNKLVVVRDSDLLPIRNQRGQDEMLRLTGKPKADDKVILNPVKETPHV
jgi:hypothetical protein